jgi:N-acylneuraminate cytidylyltransferase
VIIAMMPLRGGSKGIPRKNIKPFLGRPLFSWNMSALVDSGVPDKIYANTDDKEIAVDVRSRFPRVKVFFSHLHSDRSRTIEIVEEFIKGLDDKDVFMLSQATSPYLTSEDVKGAYKLFEEGNYNSVMSGSRFHRFVWDTLRQDSLTGPKYNRAPRQEREPLFLQNGCLYITTVGMIRRTHEIWGGRIGFYYQGYGFELDNQNDWVYGETVLNAARDIK